MPYMRQPKPKEKCIVDGCNQNRRALGMCPRHYWQIRNIGFIRNKEDKNPDVYVKHDGYAEIRVHDLNNEYRISAFIDIDDIEKCKEKKWQLRKSKTSQYVSTCIAHRGVPLHNYLMGPLPDGYDEWDHIDRDTMNNRRGNLRPARRADNVCNVEPYKNKSSKYKGVSWFKQLGKWRADIRKEGKLTYLGSFNNEEDAAIAYNDAAERVHGEFAYLNNAPQQQRNLHHHLGGINEHISITKHHPGPGHGYRIADIKRGWIRVTG